MRLLPKDALMRDLCLLYSCNSVYMSVELGCMEGPRGPSGPGHFGPSIAELMVDFGRGRLSRSGNRTVDLANELSQLSGEENGRC